MKKFVGGLAAVLAIFILAIGGYSKKPLVFSAPGPDIINFPEASVEYLERIILKEGGEYQKGEKIFVDRVDYYIEIDDNDSVAIYEKFEALKGEKSRRVEVKLTQAVIHFALASRPREIAGRILPPRLWRGIRSE